MKLIQYKILIIIIISLNNSNNNSLIITNNSVHHSTLIDEDQNDTFNPPAISIEENKLASIDSYVTFLKIKNQKHYYRCETCKKRFKYLNNNNYETNLRKHLGNVHKIPNIMYMIIINNYEIKCHIGLNNSSQKIYSIDLNNCLQYNYYS